ncbi:unnamed protein product (macronuclear) [Paramecium tetraurelia]|uniref:Uncharacterized protein n=1 Tax=Paramecium tetraurelia TaxID=5888 RepID=A0E641_PARTE|nr:uncharacterized protein GSPATT00003621001 [Paramecium tetraurelia]CAK90758.1 unnamed protein product [Paramecium tetraurelia]|eukprot:XP_001458155.1 hypothetical protein (macronuclear) [Paramecium tetraurelia strain d4-2]
MHQGSFITNTPLEQLDDFRKEVRGKMNHMIDQPKKVYSQSSNLQQLLRQSISPKQVKNYELNKSQDPPHHINQISSRLSFQRSSLDLGKPTQNILYPKKQLQDILPLNKILELQRAINNYNHPTNNSYFIELKKLAKIVLRETQG